jgi:hypothetical protein
MSFCVVYDTSHEGARAAGAPSQVLLGAGRSFRVVIWSQVRARLRTSGLSSCGMGKSLARFTGQLVRQKAQQFLNDDCATCLLNGVRVSAPKKSNWFSSWEAEYGLSMRNANRKYMVPKWVMGERLEIAWKNIARIWALCHACHGYDPQMKNWDQCPFHSNETGSADLKTLAVSGSVVIPLVEGHADTRKRWTTNLVTFSDTARIQQDGPPYCEFVFKGGEKLELRLRQFFRERGVGPWLSVATTDSGSYKMPDVIKFLKTHLPDILSPQSRQWRIIIASAFSAHLSPQVLNLCWNRGYILITLGGSGITPVVQTCDTDLKQHVKRHDMALETAELLQQMRDGINVPSDPPERCIDVMAEVLTKTSVHLDAAEGYVKVGFTVPLDGSGGQYIVREAGNFWRERGMRAKINETNKQGRDDYIAGLVVECPKHRQYDDILGRIEDEDASISHGELPYLEDNEADQRDAGDHCGGDGEDNATAVAGQDDAEPAVAGEASAHENADAGDMDDAAVPDQRDEQSCDLGWQRAAPWFVERCRVHMMGTLEEIFRRTKSNDLDHEDKSSGSDKRGSQGAPPPSKFAGMHVQPSKLGSISEAEEMVKIVMRTPFRAGLEMVENMPDANPEEFLAKHRNMQFLGDEVQRCKEAIICELVNKYPCSERHLLFSLPTDTAVADAILNTSRYLNYCVTVPERAPWKAAVWRKDSRAFDTLAFWQACLKDIRPHVPCAETMQTAVAEWSDPKDQIVGWLGMTAIEDMQNVKGMDAWSFRAALAQGSVGVGLCWSDGTKGLRRGKRNPLTS